MRAESWGLMFEDCWLWSLYEFIICDGIFIVFFSLLIYINFFFGFYNLFSVINCCVVLIISSVILGSRLRVLC